MSGFIFIAVAFFFLQRIFDVTFVNDNIMHVVWIYKRVKIESPFYQQLGYFGEKIDSELSLYYLLMYICILLGVLYIFVVSVGFQSDNARAHQIWSKLGALSAFNKLGAFVMFITGIYMSLFPSSDLTIDKFNLIASYNMTLYLLLHLFLFSTVIFFGSAVIPVYFYRKARVPHERVPHT
jgi:hypothetical protein